jgi:hypothetical protein
VRLARQRVNWRQQNNGGGAAMAAKAMAAAAIWRHNHRWRRRNQCESGDRNNQQKIGKACIGGNGSNGIESVCGGGGSESAGSVMAWQLWRRRRNMAWRIMKMAKYGERKWHGMKSSQKMAK